MMLTAPSRPAYHHPTTLPPLPGSQLSLGTRRVDLIAARPASHPGRVRPGADIQRASRHTHHSTQNIRTEESSRRRGGGKERRRRGPKGKQTFLCENGHSCDYSQSHQLTRKSWISLHAGILGCPHSDSHRNQTPPFARVPSLFKRSKPADLDLTHLSYLIRGAPVTVLKQKHDSHQRVNPNLINNLCKFSCSYECFLLKVFSLFLGRK